MRANVMGVVSATMDEHEAYTNLIEALGIARAACRQLGFMRANVEGLQTPQQLAAAQGWFKLAELMGAARDNSIALANRKIMS